MRMSGEKSIVAILKRKLAELELEHSRLLSDLNERGVAVLEVDPERSGLHDIWYIYKMQREYKEFLEALLDLQESSY